MLAPDWAIDFPGRSSAPGWFRAMVNRPFLTQFFPGFDVYLCLDVDAWVQDAQCLSEFVTATESGSVAVVPERFGPPVKYVTQLPDGRYLVQEISEPAIRQNLAKSYRDCFGPEYEKYANQPVRNCGVFAIRGDSPAWGIWQEYFNMASNMCWSIPPIDRKSASRTSTTRRSNPASASRPLRVG